MADLIGDTSHQARSFTAEEVGLGFTNNAEVQNVSDLLAEQYETAAATLATNVTQDLPTLLGCQPDAAGQDACVKQFLPKFGLRAYRRPLSGEEVDRLFAFYQTSKSSADFQTGVRLMLQAMFQSPHFLYRVEAGGDPVGVTKLSGYELASRLSYLFWGSMPDQALLDAAATGRLDTAGGVAEQARRLAQSPAHQRALVEFFDEWLDLDKLSTSQKDAAIFPLFTPAVKSDLRTETEMFTSSIAFGGGSLRDLLTAGYTFVNRDLAGFYGLADPGSTDFVKTNLDGVRRGGLLTQGALLAAYANVNQTSPVARGFFVRDRFLCSPPPPPPATVNALPPALDPNLTTRQRFDQHRTNPSCAACHNLMDPVGFGFEHFDGIGLWRDKEGTSDIDATGTLAGTKDVDGPFNGAIDLSSKLAGSAQVRQCLVKQWFRFGYGRGETDSDACVLTALDSDFVRNGGKFSDLLISLAQSDAFLYRTNEAGDGK